MVFPSSIMSNKLDVVTYNRLTGIKIEPVHLIQMHPDIDPNNLPDPHCKMFIPPNREEPVSATDVTDWNLFAHPKNVEELLHTGENITLRYRYECDPTKP
jgi:hypothetical protein